jgi:hypothetical protein
MEITQKFIDELLTHAMDIAKGNKERKGFKGEFLPVALVIGQHGEQAVLPTPFASNEQKQFVMAALSEGARQENAVAVALIQDTRVTDLNAFDAHFELPPEADIEKRKQRYEEIISNRFGGTTLNLPDSLYIDSLVVAIKGPFIKPQTLRLSYKEGVGDSVIWGEREHSNLSFMYVLDDWWEPATVN